ncbi:hypothetical protein ABH309_17430 [Chromobacterium piscinae]|uniref:Apea-like HEPN domain-containing protein n=1 Tax=Chromobacterium piscinae TaxID=686831 RepID=A0ABV0H815_9NEIS
MEKHEPVYNIYVFIEANELREMGIKEYYRQGSDDKKLAFLSQRAMLDFSSVQRVPVGVPIPYDEYFARQRLGSDIIVYEPLFSKVKAGSSPLYCVTPVIDGVPTVNISVPPGPLDMSKLPDDITGRGKMDDYLIKYLNQESGTYDMPALINDDYFKAIRLLFRNQHYISCLKLLMSFLDTIAYVEFGDRERGKPSVFTDWVRTFASSDLAGATPEELWEFRNSLLHMSNLDSKKVSAGKVVRLMPYVGSQEHPPSMDPMLKYISVNKLIDDVAEAIQKWIVSYNEFPDKWLTFIQRYDRVVSDDRNAFVVMTPTK